MKRSFLVFLLFLMACSSEPLREKTVHVRLTPPSAKTSENSDPLPAQAYYVEPKAPLNASYVLDKLGPPTSKLVSAPHETWAYSRKTCVLFLFVDRSSDAAIVEHLEVRGKSSVQDMDIRACESLKERIL